MDKVECKPLGEWEVIKWLKHNRDIGVSLHFAPKEVQDFVISNPSIMDYLDENGKWSKYDLPIISDNKAHNTVFSTTEENIFLWRYRNHKFDIEDRSNLAFHGVDDSVVKQISGYKHRWQTEMTTIFRVGSQLFAIDWMEGNTEMQEHEFDNDPYEVEAKEVTIVTYVRKSDGRVLEDIDTSDDEDDEDDDS